MPRPLLLLACVASLASAQTADTTEQNQKKLEKRVDRLKKDAQREARSTSTLGCTDLLQQTGAACGEAYTRGLPVNCLMLTTALKMSAKQAQGKLFETGDASTDVQAAHAACRVHLRSIDRARKKSEGTLTAADAAPAECTELASLLKTQCFDPFPGTNTFSPACEQLFRLAHLARPGRATSVQAGAPAPSPADRCKAPLAAYRQFVEMTRPRP